LMGRTVYTYFPTWLDAERMRPSDTAAAAANLAGLLSPAEAVTWTRYSKATVLRCV
jgi:hypothetical protein